MITGEPGQAGTVGMVEGWKAEAEGYVRGSLSAIPVRSVVIRAREAWDDRAFIDVIVDCDATPAEIAANEPPGFLSGLRAQLEKSGVDAFPLVGFRNSQYRVGNGGRVIA